MTEGSGTPLECPDCGYETRVWDADGHTDECPECDQGELMPPVAADAVKRDRVKRSPAVKSMLDADDATEVILAPEGSTDFDGVTSIGGVPIIESPTYGTSPVDDLFDDAIADHIDPDDPKLFDQLETVEMEMPDATEVIKPIYDMGSRDPVGHQTIGRTYEGSLSVDLDPDEDESFRDWLEDAIEEADRSDYDGPLG